ncbi:methyltransferase [Leucobacter denitrificans]|uniref:Class I SAM-dependent methyltransferase n=1 Tax=Leucobacter denitrificans TaxID=683042 RepID=A0A7G9S7L9_9MICO|nr:class I SAM-dependent methyltransferase [Leucobacter denitrificans]QNN63844.1 class I SAM-dependent methyltransferase [Leucobacter denitrificans]
MGDTTLKTDLRLLNSLRKDLESAKYFPDEIVALWGAPAERSRQRGVLIPAARMLRRLDKSPLVTLAELFLLGDEASAEDLELALPELGISGAMCLGLIASSPERSGRPSGYYRAELSLNVVSFPDPGSTRPEPGEAVPIVHWWIMSDLDDALRRGPMMSDHVMGVGGATRTLLSQMPLGGGERAMAERALDLGTGSGVVAMYLAQSGIPEVVATDISERALALAQANAALNGFSSEIEFRQGDLFGPVREEQFDLIASNPPFVVTPRTEQTDVAGAQRYEYRDGGLIGDALAARVVREAPIHLAEGGLLICLANWETPWGGDGLQRVEQWIAEASETHALDAWVIERDVVDTVQYAETWARDGGARPGSSEHSLLMSAWMDDFEDRHIVSIGLGSIRLQRTDKKAGIVRTEQAMGIFTEDWPGRSLQTAFESGVRSERMSDEDVLAAHWVCSPRVFEERDHKPGQDAPRALRLVTDAPIGRRMDVDPLLAAAVGASDGDLSLSQIAGALATLFEVNEEETSDVLVEGIRELAWYGVVTPASR